MVTFVCFLLLTPKGETEWDGMLVGEAVPQNLETNTRMQSAVLQASAAAEEWETRWPRASGAASWEAFDQKLTF